MSTMSQDTTQPEGVAWLNPANLPAGCQVTVWEFDDEGPNPEPVTLETRDTHTEMTRLDAARLGNALLGAAHMQPAPTNLRVELAEVRRDLAANEGSEDARLAIAEATIERLTGPEARERLARHLWIADAGDPDVWDNLNDHLTGLRAKGENGEWLARGVEKSVTQLREQAARYVAVIAGKEN